MIDKKKIIETLKKYEGVVPHAYQDQLGYWTIGIGRLVDKRKGGGLSQTEMEYLLNNDIIKCVNALESQIEFFKTLTESQQEGLIYMAFQLGIGGLLKFKSMLHALDGGYNAEVVYEIKSSKWYAQTPQRAELVIQLLTGGSNDSSTH